MRKDLKDFRMCGYSSFEKKGLKNDFLKIKQFLDKFYKTYEHHDISPIFRIFIESPFDKKIKNGIDTSKEQTGFLYFLRLYNSETKKGFIKIGISKNPIFRLSEHKLKTYKNYRFDIFRVCRCFDYLKCEAEIKKLTDGKEFFETNREIFQNINKIIDDHCMIELDPITFETLIETESLKKIFKNNNYSK